jgi:predicted RecB family nuclease
VLPDRGERPDAARDRGLGLLATFHEQAPRPHRVIGVEEPFAIELPELDGVRLVGVFDAIVQDADGAYRIIEHKTARRRWTKSRLDFDLQLSAYTLAAPLMGLGLAPVTLQLLLSTKEPAFESVSVVRGPSDHRDLRAILIGVQRSITAGIFFPRRDWHCATCPYSGPCLLAG